VDRTSFISDSTRIRPGDIARMRSGADWDRPVISIDGEAYRFGNCFYQLVYAPLNSANSADGSEWTYLCLLPELG
jgi:hypothetical protein